jgi:hypothetical protein
MDKFCSKCRLFKSSEDFYLKKKGGILRCDFCKSCTKNIVKAWRLKNKERSMACQKNWRDSNRERLQEYFRTYAKQHPDVLRRINAKSRALKKQAVPLWIDHDLVRDMYQEAEYQQMHVDHIVPLNSKSVYGLHWEGNLQLLTRDENLRKGNVTWPDQWPTIVN